MWLTEESLCGISVFLVGLCVFLLPAVPSHHCNKLLVLPEET